jgi:hypothetical protein
MNSVADRQRKIDWLLKNQNLWSGFYDIDNHRAKRIILHMKEAGVISRKTYWRDVRLYDMMQQAREQRRTGIRWSGRSASGAKGRAPIAGRKRGPREMLPSQLGNLRFSVVNVKLKNKMEISYERPENLGRRRL